MPESAPGECSTTRPPKSAGTGANFKNPAITNVIDAGLATRRKHGIAKRRIASRPNSKIQPTNNARRDSRLLSNLQPTRFRRTRNHEPYIDRQLIFSGQLDEILQRPARARNQHRNFSFSSNVDL